MGDLLARLQSALGDAYRIEKELGGGGMSRLFLATEASLHRQVVIKLLPPEFTSEVSAARFKQEIELAAHLQHPNILPVLTAGAKDDLLFYVMPFVSGESLRHRLTREGKLPVADAVRILYEMADALAYAHAEGVIHRDVKPENILLLGAHAGLTDFGVARALAEARSGGRLTDTGLALGTPGYMSPEQAAGDRNIDARADVYALAVVGYEMLAGRPPFAGPTAQAVIAAHLTATPEPLTDLRPETPSPVANAIARALAKDPNARLRTAAEFRDRIGAPAAAQDRRPSNAARLAVAAVLGIGLVATASAIFLWRHRGSGIPAESAIAARRPMLVVLPFRNLGAARDQYFTDGLTEEVTTRLSEISGVGVIGHASASEYERTSKSLKQIAEELGVQYVLQGTVRTDRGPRGAGQARVAPQLIRVSDATNLWAQAYTVSLAPGEIFGVQGKIAEQVAQALNVSLLAQEREAVTARPTENQEAYEAYLRGNDYLQRGGGQNWEAQRVANELFERATKLDSRFALAYAGLAATNMLMFRNGYDWSMVPHLTHAARLARAREAAEQALQLNPRLPRALGALGEYYAALGDSIKAGEQFARWLRAAPQDPMANAVQGWRDVARGRWSDAAASFERAMQLDPRSVSVLGLAISAYSGALRFRDAEPYADRWIALAPDLAGPYTYKAWLAVAQGDTVTARRVLSAATASVGRANLLVAISRHSYIIKLLRVLPEYGAAVQGLSMDSFGTDTADYLAAKAMAYRLAPDRARPYYDSLRAWAAATLRADSALLPSNLEIHVVLAWTYAGLGRTVEAVDVIDRLEKRVGKLNPDLQGLAAEVYVMCGNYEAAVNRLTSAVASPFFVPTTLRLDPIWEPLRGNPRFQALLNAR